MTTFFVQQIIDLTRQAAAAILAVYNEEGHVTVTVKEDESPLTRADMAAHNILSEGLALIEDIPVLSEESVIPEFDERQQWSRYWLVDPLDGTKEFIDRNGEFTVNVALIDNGRPILGVITVPVSGLVYWGGVVFGAHKIADNIEHAIEARALSTVDKVEVVASRRHSGALMESVCHNLDATFSKVAYKSMGSSLKFCLLAEGLADIYPRLAPTSEWDTAAAQAIVEGAGGQVVGLDFEPLLYNAKASLRNPYFYVVADTTFDWKTVLSIDISVDIQPE